MNDAAPVGPSALAGATPLAAAPVAGAPPSGAPLGAPIFPTTTNERITVLAHYHRAEIARMAGWRDRIDRTTNWAITVVAALLSVSLSSASSHHGVLVFGMAIVLLLLLIEARRYRFFDVYRARVRLMERNYFAQIFAPSPEGDEGWRQSVGDGLRRPTFIITTRAAFARRLKRNYIWLFLIMLAAWVLKLASHKLQAGAATSDFALSWADFAGNAALGPIDGRIVLAAVALFYLTLFALVARREAAGGELAYGDAHV